MVMILPHLEQQIMFNALNFYQGFTANGEAARGAITGGTVVPFANTTVAFAQINTILCPSDIDRLTTSEGHLNYVFCMGSDAYGNNTPSPFNGVFGPAAAGNTTFAGILDGSSNTAGVRAGQGDRQLPGGDVRYLEADDLVRGEQARVDGCQRHDPATGVPDVQCRFSDTGQRTARDRQSTL